MTRVALALSLVLVLVLGTASGARAMIAVDVIRDVIRGARDTLGQCLAAAPPGTYAVSVRFVIEPDGTVSRAEPTASDLAGDDPALDCVLRTVLALRFPPSGRRDHVVVHYPFRFVR